MARIDTARITRTQPFAVPSLRRPADKEQAADFKQSVGTIARSYGILKRYTQGVCLRLNDFTLGPRQEFPRVRYPWGNDFTMMPPAPFRKRVVNLQRILLREKLLPIKFSNTDFHDIVLSQTNQRDCILDLVLARAGIQQTSRLTRKVVPMV